MKFYYYETEAEPDILRRLYASSDEEAIASAKEHNASLLYEAVDAFKLHVAWSKRTVDSIH